MKALTIAWKDTLIRLRDRNALILAVVAPILISAIMGAALNGHINPQESPVPNTSVLLVNDDAGNSGKNLVDALAQEGLADSFAITQVKNFDVARGAVAKGTAQAAIHIPANFSSSLLLGGEQNPTFASGAGVTVYTASSTGTNPHSAGEAVKRLVGRLNTTLISRRVSFEQLKAKPGAGGTRDGLEPVLNEELPVGSFQSRSPDLKIESITTDQGASTSRNPFAFFAPSLAIFFLMMSMFEAPRSILLEQEEGTLGRLLRAPISSTQILLGKLGGSYLTGILQFTLLVVAARLIFNLRWGTSVVALGLMVVALVAASASMGAVVAAFSKDALQAGALGGAITLLSAGLGGNFFAADRMPAWLQVLSRLTINRWALEGFSNLTVRGLGLRAVLLDAGVLFSIAVGLFILAFWKFQRRIAV